MKIQYFTLAVALGLGFSASAQVTSTVRDIAPYVYPQNRPAAPPSFSYAPDGNGYLLLSADGKAIVRYDIATGKEIETVFDVRHTREEMIESIEGFEMSANGRYILVYNDTESVYRRSFKAKYYVYEAHSRILKPLSANFDKQQSPLISPDGRMVAFVAENNIYVRKNDYGSEVQVTKDGEKNVKINGIPDWVYEEEFSCNVSMAWAPDNLTLCYLSYDESQVPLYTLPQYQGTCDPMNQYEFYPGYYQYKYPVAGEKNSVVSLHSYDVETRKIKDIDLPDSKIEYIPRIEFGNSPERLMVATLNRDQNHFELYSVNPKSTVVKSVYAEESKAWIDPSTYENITYLDDGFMLLSDKSGYRHIYKYSYAGAPLRTVTSGDYDVTDFYGVDSKGVIYYQAAKPTPMDRIVYSVNLKGQTELVSKENGTSSASFSDDMAYALINYSDANTPPVYSMCKANGKQVRMLEDNSAYAAKHASLPKKVFFTMESDGQVLNGYYILPSKPGKRPVIMSQYSGPGSQSVLNRWSLDWEQYFAMQGYAVVCVDGRGTGGRGRQFQDIVYRQLGYYETIDQVNAARWAAAQPWADASKIGIYGWSYGGFEALMASTVPGGPYAAAVSVAPVTSWRFYDSIYTERYMLTPQQNERGYELSPLDRASQLQCPLLLMYGTADDNVHPVNALMFVSALQSAGGLCDVFPFVNMNHSIYGCNSRAVVYAKMLDFFNKNL